MSSQGRLLIIKQKNRDLKEVSYLKEEFPSERQAMSDNVPRLKIFLRGWYRHWRLKDEVGKCKGMSSDGWIGSDIL